MLKLNLSSKEINLICNSLEEFYDNLQYNNLSKQMLKKQQIDISKLVTKLFNEPEGWKK